jgi:hypothetical protein
VNNHELLRSILPSLLALGLIVPSMAAQQPSSIPETPTKMVVTVEPRHGSSSVPTISRQDVMVYEGHNRDQVTDLVPLQGNNAGLELFIVLDDGLRSSVDSQISDLQKFISAQPATTAIGLGYMRDGTVSVAQNPATDHAQAAKALRIPFGERGISPSPYESISELIKKWPVQGLRREILMISDGIDALYGGGPDDPYLDQEIQDAQKANVIVFSIYAPGAGHYGHSFWRMSWGQTFESQLSDETGGEAYNIGLGSPVSFAPYLEDLSQRLTRQYLVTFVAKTEKKAGMRKISLKTEVPNTELVAADRAFIPAGE